MKKLISILAILLFSVNVFSANIPIDYMETTCDTDAHAQAAYVTNAGRITLTSYETITTDQLITCGDFSDTEYRPAQSFQVANTSTVFASSVRFGANGGSPTGQVTLRIETDNSGKPSGTLVDANATIAFTPSASAWNNVVFPGSFSLTASTTYWVRLYCDNQSTSNRWTISGYSSGGYASGDMAYTTDGGTNWTVTEQDIAFKISGDYSLQSYSGSEKTQGSYSLKAVAVATDSLNKTLIRTISPTINLSDQTLIKFDMRTSRTGSNIKLGFHDSGGTTTEVTPNQASADTFQTNPVDISEVSNANKDAIDSVIITVVNADDANTIYIDNMFDSVCNDVFGLVD